MKETNNIPDDVLAHEVKRRYSVLMLAFKSLQHLVSHYCSPIKLSNTRINEAVYELGRAIQEVVENAIARAIRTGKVD